MDLVSQRLLREEWPLPRARSPASPRCCGPLLDFVERSLEEWVQPGSQQVFALRDAVVELGDALTEKAVSKLTAGGKVGGTDPAPGR
jgi:hypothetical protein